MTPRNPLPLPKRPLPVRIGPTDEPSTHMPVSPSHLQASSAEKGLLLNEEKAFFEDCLSLEMTR